MRICARRPGFLFVCVQAGGCGCRCVFELGKEAPTGSRNGLMINDQGECSVGGTPQQPQPLNKSRRVMLPAPRSSSHSFTPREKKHLLRSIIPSHILSFLPDYEAMTARRSRLALSALGE